MNIYLIHIDYDLAAKKGISVDNAMATLQTMLGSFYATNFIRFSQMYKVMVQASPQFRQNPESILDMYLKNDAGEMVPFSTFIKLERVYGPEVLTRYNMYMSAMINGEPAEDWRAISLLLVEQVGSPAVDITVQQLEGSDQSYQLDLTDWVFDPDKQSVFGSLGLEPLRPEVLNEISQIQAGSAAEAAGLQLGDKLVSVDGKTVSDWNSVVTLVQNNPEKPLLFGIERAGQSMDILVTPQSRRCARHPVRPVPDPGQRSGVQRPLSGEQHTVCHRRHPAGLLSHPPTA